MGALVSLANGQLLALVGGGTVTLTEVGRENGDRVRGRWDGFVGVVPAGGVPAR
jgi:hypothetical protein